MEAHELAFHYFGGVFRRLRYDNLSSAVKKILRGYERELTARFIAFRSHWQYQAVFCTPGEGHEKGGVEGEVGYFRRNHWVPIPVAGDLAELNAKLLVDCHDDENRRIAGRQESVGALLLTEKEHLLPLPAEDFELAEVSFPKVDQAGCAIKEIHGSGRENRFVFWKRTLKNEKENGLIIKAKFEHFGAQSHQ